MKEKDILSKVDHTYLKSDAKLEDIQLLCDDAIKFNTASVCIPPSYVEFASNYIRDKNSDVKVCTVIGFPNGYNTTKTKCFEAKCAIEDGADEIDMVVNIGWIKDKKYQKILDEIKQIKACIKDKILKVIIETCLLTDEEKIKMCGIVSKSGAEYIKTSTGFSKAGANFHDVELMVKNVENGVKVKAAGGINSLEDGEKFISIGASRLGTSRIVKIIKENNK